MATRLQPKSRERILAAARTLFEQKGFHSTPISELASTAQVSVGQIYRLFPGKDDIIVAIVEDDTEARIAELGYLFEAMRAGRSTAFDAIKAVARLSIEHETALSFEMLAEAYRNPRVADRIATLSAEYRGHIRELAVLARPEVPPSELDAYADILMACFFGLGHRTLVAPSTDVELASHQTACLLARALNVRADPLPKQAAKPSPALRSAGVRKARKARP